MHKYFIIGVPRTGTTMLYDVLIESGQFGFVSNWLNRFPRQDGLSVLNRIHDIAPDSLMKHANRERDNSRLAAYVPRPVEPWTYLDETINGFPIWITLRWANDYDLALKDFERELNPKEKLKAVKKLATCERLNGKPLLIKYTGHTRINYIRQVAPLSRFVYIERDFCPVALSNYKLQYEGREATDWTRWKSIHLKAMPEEWVRVFNEQPDLLSFAALQVKLNMRDNERELELYKEDILRIRYEDIMSNPLPHFKDISDFTGAEIMPSIAKQVRNKRFRSCNDKWKRNLTEQQQERLIQIRDL